MSALLANTVAKVFLRPKRAILIQDRAQAHNIDSSSIQSNSIIAHSRRSKEFCNTIGTNRPPGMRRFGRYQGQTDIKQATLSGLDL
jgi:hypothetical protein